MLNDKLSSERIQKYFADRLATDPEITKTGNLLGWGEFDRAKKLQKLKIDDTNFNKVTHIMSLELFTPTYIIYEQESSVVLAIKGEQILWLDDHIKNHEFASFIVEEQMFSRLPEDPYIYAKAIVETKLNYVAHPMVVRNIHEIPKDAWVQSKEFRDQRLKTVHALEPFVKEPSIYVDGEEKRIEFVIWTKIRGEIIRVRCTWDGLKFYYSGVTLAQSIGDYMMPR